MMSKGTLYLLPCPIDDSAPEKVLPAANFEIMRSLDYFIVENTRTARRFLSRAGVASQSGEGEGTRPIDSLEFVELNEHTRPGEVEAMIAPLLAGRSAGVISEAGVPAVADPGTEIVAAAHRHGIRVVPLVGPSSILLALMASGANGQSFAFNGYLPAKAPERTRAIKHFEKRASTERQAQIFIETPYRSGRLFEELIAACSPETLLTIAAEITSPEEIIRTLPVARWRKTPAPNIDKRPTIFIIG
jgi:16S rRNA (cytidine1402-2'-O)-methyltransferase